MPVIDFIADRARELGHTWDPSSDEARRCLQLIKSEGWLRGLALPSKRHPAIYARLAKLELIERQPTQRAGFWRITSAGQGILDLAEKEPT